MKTPFDHLDDCIKYGAAPDHSGIHVDGKGTLERLKHISVPTYIYGSRAEYNTEFTPTCRPEFKGTVAPCCPEYECVYEQLKGASARELYVDNLTDQKCFAAHMWRYHRYRPGIDPWPPPKDDLKSYGDGAPLEVLCSFLRRHVVGGTNEAPPEEPRMKRSRSLSLAQLRALHVHEHVE